MTIESFESVRTLDDLDTLDGAVIVAGYREFDRDAPWPGENRGRAYWHGCRNAAIDHYVIPKDDAAAQLAHAWVRRSRLKETAHA